MRSKDKTLMERIRVYIDEYAMEHLGNAPTTRDIGAEFRMSHVTAYRYLVAMDELGMIGYHDGEIHTELLDKVNVDYSLVGAIDASVPAGTPDMVDDANVEKYIPIPSSFLRGQKGKFYSMPVHGGSMVSAGIDDGDIVIFNDNCEPAEGDIVVAYIDGEGNTLKRFCKDKKGSYLWAENESWPDKKRMFGRNFTVRGIALKIVKDL